MKHVLLKLTVSMALCAVLTACAEGGRKKAAVRMNNSPETFTHCRLGTADGQPVSWLTGKTTLADLVSKNTGEDGRKYSYLIFDSDGNPPGSDADIFPGDEMEIFYDGTDVRLRHTGQRHDKRINHLTEPLAIGKEQGFEDLYAIAELKNSDGVAGKYVMFWTKEGTSCQNPKASSRKCRRIHFEYFRFGNSEHFPPKMINKKTDQGCPRPNQTDDGDGDEGVNR
ncbi:hypothetical protein [Tahibacter sp.]|uniref:hypothetical protein n=1 Tax=Tahibacter sp. TaxID=2056211 RepID=UPI0028C395E6|nr:hypothetical protein [Tahibacter sp.]